MSGVANGFGTKLIGRSDYREEDGSWVSVIWLVLFFLPVLPLRCHRVVLLPWGADFGPELRRRKETNCMAGHDMYAELSNYALLEDLPMRWRYVCRQVSFSLLVPLWLACAVPFALLALWVAVTVEFHFLFFILIAGYVFALPFYLHHRLGVWWDRREAAA